MLQTLVTVSCSLMVRTTCHGWMVSSEMISGMQIPGYTRLIFSLQSVLCTPSPFKTFFTQLLMAPNTLLKLRRWLWGSDPADSALLIKLDFTILPYFSLIWFLFGLSRSSYATAYISGMKDALHFQGKDFNYLNTTYLVVYAVCQMPGTSLLTIASPKYVFVTANVAWSVLTLITFKMNHVWQIILLNAFEGGFSAIA